MTTSASGIWGACPVSCRASPRGRQRGVCACPSGEARSGCPSRGTSSSRSPSTRWICRANPSGGLGDRFAVGAQDHYVLALLRAKVFAPAHGRLHCVVVVASTIVSESRGPFAARWRCTWNGNSRRKDMALCSFVTYRSRQCLANPTIAALTLSMLGHRYTLLWDGMQSKAPGYLKFSEN